MRVIFESSKSINCLWALEVTPGQLLERRKLVREREGGCVTGGCSCALVSGGAGGHTRGFCCGRQPGAWLTFLQQVNSGAIKVQLGEGRE